MSHISALDVAEKALSQIYVTCDALEVVQKNPRGEDVVVSSHKGEIRDSYPFFMQFIGGLLFSTAVKTGFREPVTDLSDIAQVAEHLASQAESGYIVRVKGLKMEVPQVEAIHNSYTKAGKSAVDLTAQMWGGAANPFASAWADTLKQSMDAGKEMLDVSQTLPEGEYDLGEFAQTMAEWANIVEQWHAIDAFRA